MDVARQGKVAEFLAEPYMSDVASCLTRTKVRTSFVDVPPYFLDKKKSIDDENELIQVYNR